MPYINEVRTEVETKDILVCVGAKCCECDCELLGMSTEEKPYFYPNGALEIHIGSGGYGMLLDDSRGYDILFCRNYALRFIRVFKSITHALKFEFDREITNASS